MLLKVILIDSTLYSVTNIPNNPFKQKFIKELLNINFYRIKVLSLCNKYVYL